MASASGVRMRTTNGRGFILDTKAKVNHSTEAHLISFLALALFPSIPE